MTTHMYSHACAQVVGYFDFRLFSDQICGTDHGRVGSSWGRDHAHEHGSKRRRRPRALLVNGGRDHRSKVSKRKQDEQLRV